VERAGGARGRRCPGWRAVRSDDVPDPRVSARHQHRPTVIAKPARRSRPCARSRNCTPKSAGQPRLEARSLSTLPARPAARPPAQAQAVPDRRHSAAVRSHAAAVALTRPHPACHRWSNRQPKQAASHGRNRGYRGSRFTSAYFATFNATNSPTPNATP
jgi:hypothetical protein